MQTGFWVDLGQMEYEEANIFQEQVHFLRVCDVLPDTLIMVEHSPVFTIGRSGGYEHIKGEVKNSEVKGIKVIKASRGGSITFHGYGQIVVYPIIHIECLNGDLLLYLRLIENLIIRVLGEYGIFANRFSPHTGVWVGKEKIAAIGVACSGSVTSHGFAINVTTDMSFFAMIKPCGIEDYGVTSMARHLLGPPSISAVKDSIIEAYNYVFRRLLTRVEPEELFINSKSKQNILSSGV